MRTLPAQCFLLGFLAVESYIPRNRQVFFFSKKKTDTRRRKWPPRPSAESLFNATIDDGSLTMPVISEPLSAVLDNNNSIAAPANSQTTDSATAERWAVLLLNGVAVLWGTQHAVIKGLVMNDDNPSTYGGLSPSYPTTMTPALMTWVRFTIAALLASPPAALAGGATKRSSLARWGLEMGFWMFLGFSLQAIGLQTTTAQRSGFLLYLNVKFVPFLAYLLYQRPIRTWTWISAFTAFTGTALLSYTTDATTTTGLFQLNTGDLWTIAAALASAMFIIRLETASTEVSDAAQLNAASLWVVSILALLWTVVLGTTPSFLVDDALNDAV
jgi:drug/metabolite transporter (DMT)-like permease